MENCIEKIRKWMIQAKLLINDSTTEMILLGSKQQLSKLQPISISVGNSAEQRAEVQRVQNAAA